MRAWDHAPPEGRCDHAERHDEDQEEEDAPAEALGPAVGDGAQPGMAIGALLLYGSCCGCLLYTSRCV